MNLIGNRLRQARLAAGFSLDELASRLQRPLSKQALSKYETNKSQPSTSTLLDLARALNVKASRLLAESEVSVEWVAYRKHADLSKTRRETITAMAAHRLEGEFQMRELFNLGTGHDLPTKIPVFDFGGAEAAAEKVREAWGLGDLPIKGMIETIEEHGGVVMAWEEGAGFDGLCGWANHNAPVMVINLATSPDRRRYNATHELGHLVMSCEGADVDEESLAHRFAAAFLVSRLAALREIGTRRRTLAFAELGLLKQRWGLSMQAWVRRAHDLGVIDEAHYRQLSIEFSRRNWRRDEPYKYEGTEEPVLLRRLLWRGLSEGIITDQDAEEILPGYESEPEARLESGKISLRDLARLEIAERRSIIEQSLVEVDVAETKLWDAAACDVMDDEPAYAAR